MTSQNIIDQAAYSQLAAKERKYQEEQAARFQAMLREESRLRREVSELQLDLSYQTSKGYLLALSVAILVGYEAIRFFN